MRSRPKFSIQPPQKRAARNRVNVEPLEPRVLLSHGVGVAQDDDFGPRPMMEHAAQAHIAFGPDVLPGDAFGAGENVAFVAPALIVEILPALPPAGEVANVHQDVMVVETILYVSDDVSQTSNINTPSPTDPAQSNSQDCSSSTGTDQTQSATSNGGTSQSNSMGSSQCGQTQTTLPPSSSGQSASNDHSTDGSSSTEVATGPGVRHLVLHPDSSGDTQSSPPTGPDVVHPTLPPAGTPVNLPAPVAQPNESIVPPRVPVPTASPAVTPLALTPASPQAVQTLDSGSASGIQVTSTVAPHVGSSVAPAGDLPHGLEHVGPHWLGPIALALPSLPQAKDAAIATANVVEAATGSINITGAVSQDAGALMTTELAGQTLAATTAYNFIHFDAAAFHDAVSVFAGELASMSGIGTTAHSSTRAWIITGAVVGFDAVFIGYLYQKGKQAKKQITLNTAC